MASSSSSRQMISSHSCEMRPKMLKDFLSDHPSCSKTSGRLLRTRSKSAIHKASEAVIRAIKFFPFATAAVVRSHAPSLLPRSISGRKKSRSGVLEEASTPKIKDILRWKSFRDVVEEISTRWLEDDDLIDFGHDEQRKGCFSFDGDEQLSPVSVLNDSPFRDDDHREEDEDEEAPVLFFTVERRKNKVMRAITEFEAIAKQQNNELKTNWKVEEKACQVLQHFKESSLLLLSNKNHGTNDVVLLDFFSDELASGELSEMEMVKMAEAWVNKVSYHGEFDSGLLDNRKACLLDMETGPMGWRKSPFHEEQQELGLDLEAQILDDLLDELYEELEQRM